MMRLFSNRFASLGRRLLGGLLALSMAWLSWGDSAIAAKAPKAETFSPSQIAEISKARTQVSAAQDRLGELDDYIQSQDWTFTSNFIHGPLGDLRRQAATINRNLPAKAQKEARQQAQDVMAKIERIDAAAKDRSFPLASREYPKLAASLASYLALVPEFEPEVKPEAASKTQVTEVLAAPAAAVSASLEKLVDAAQEGAESAINQLEGAVNAIQDGAESVQDSVEAAIAD